MNDKELSEMTDKELLDEMKQRKSVSITRALLIGFMIGIVVFSVLKNTLGLFTLIPLFFIFKLVNHSKDDEELERLLKERNL
ncbi:MAG: FUSC family protein [Kangiellaceae bacterium]